MNTAAAFTPLGLLSVSVTGPGVALAATTRCTLTLVAVPPAFSVAVTDGEEELTALTLPSWVPVMAASAVAPGNSELGFMALITAGSVSWTSCWISCCVAGRVVGALPALTTAAMPAVQGTRPGRVGWLLPTITVPETQRNVVVPMEESMPNVVPITPATAVGVLISKLPPCWVTGATSARTRP